MAETKISLSRLQAVELYSIIDAMTGSASYKLLRSRIQEKITGVWSEIKEKGVETPKDEVRPLVLDGREQRAIAEGLLGLVNKRDASGAYTVTGAEFSFVQKVAKTCKVSKWLESQIEKDEVPEMEDALDDETPVGDEE